MKARLSILIVTLLLILPSRVSGIGPDTIFSDLQKIMERVADWRINNFTYQKDRAIMIMVLMHGPMQYFMQVC